MEFKVNKLSKGLLYVQTVLMYVAHIPFYISLLILNINESSEAISPLFLVGLILSILALFLYVIFSICGGICGISLSESPLKITKYCKLLLIPWFIFNFVLCIILFGGFLNPFLMFAIPVVIAIEIGGTYLAMVSTSIPSISYTITYLIKNKINPSTSLIAGLVMMFIFVLDIPGTMIVESELKKIQPITIL